MKLLKALPLVCFLIFAFSSFAQQQANHWYFGSHASINFTSGTAVHSDTSRMVANAASASISDANGFLQFFTDGQTVWNKHNQVMFNGLSLNAGANIAQGTLILPQPLHDSLYYIFTIGQVGNNPLKLEYSRVNMNLDNGNGAVFHKNVSLRHGITQHLTATRHANGMSIWLITMDRGLQNFILYKIDPTGIISTPLTIPVSFSLDPQTHPSALIGCMKFSPDGTRLAVNVGNRGTLVYNFNNATGAISNPMHLGGGAATYGVEFSPNNQFLYVSSISGVDQYNLTAGSRNQINASVYQVLAVGNQAKSLQVAPNGKIYIAFNNSIWLGVINTPNAARAASGYQHIILAQNAESKAGLPQFLTSYSFVEPPFFSFNEACSGDSTFFTISDSWGIDSVRWSFGDSTNGVVNTSSELNPGHLYAQSGTYEVLLTVYSQGSSKTYTEFVTVLYRPMVRITPRDTLYCREENSHGVRLSNHYPPNTSSGTYRWSTGGSSLYIDVVESGWYWLEVDNGTCSLRDSIFVRFQEPPSDDVLGNDIRVCGNTFAPIELNATTPNATYLWQDGSTEPIFYATKPGEYSVEITVGGCSAVAKKKIISARNVDFSLGTDIVTCDKTPVTLKSNYLNAEWSTGERGSSIVVTESGTYWATVQNANCTFTDSITVRYRDCITKSDIPNVITPNDDAANQTFFINKMEPFTWSLEIFNRWGQQVYTNPEYNNEWSAAGLKDGTYYYILKNPVDDEVFKGWVEVIR